MQDRNFINKYLKDPLKGTDLEQILQGMWDQRLHESWYIDDFTQRADKAWDEIWILANETISE